MKELPEALKALFGAEAEALHVEARTLRNDARALRDRLDAFANRADVYSEALAEQGAALSEQGDDMPPDWAMGAATVSEDADEPPRTATELVNQLEDLTRWALNTAREFIPA